MKTQLKIVSKIDGVEVKKGIFILPKTQCDVNIFKRVISEEFPCTKEGF